MLASLWFVASKYGALWWVAAIGFWLAFTFFYVMTWKLRVVQLLAISAASYLTWRVVAAEFLAFFVTLKNGISITLICEIVLCLIGALIFGKLFFKSAADATKKTVSELHKTEDVKGLLCHATEKLIDKPISLLNQKNSKGK